MFHIKACIEFMPPLCRLPSHPLCQFTLKLIPDLRSESGFDSIIFHFDTSSGVHFRSSPQYPPDNSLIAFSLMLSKSQQAIAPLLWVLGCMEDAVEGHLPTSVLVKDGVRKSPHQRPTILLADFRVEFRHATNCLNTGVHTVEELFPPSQVDDFRTSNMPHQRPVVLLARLLV